MLRIKLTAALLVLAAFNLSNAYGIVNNNRSGARKMPSVPKIRTPTKSTKDITPTKPKEEKSKFLMLIDNSGDRTKLLERLQKQIEQRKQRDMKLQTQQSQHQNEQQQQQQHQERQQQDLQQLQQQKQQQLQQEKQSQQLALMQKKIDELQQQQNQQKMLLQAELRQNQIKQQQQQRQPPPRPPPPQLQPQFHQSQTKIFEQKGLNQNSQVSQMQPQLVVKGMEQPVPSQSAMMQQPMYNTQYQLQSQMMQSSQGQFPQQQMQTYQQMSQQQQKPNQQLRQVPGQQHEQQMQQMNTNQLALQGVLPEPKVLMPVNPLTLDALYQGNRLIILNPVNPTTTTTTTVTTTTPSPTTAATPKPSKQATTRTTTTPRPPGSTTLRGKEKKKTKEEETPQQKFDKGTVTKQELEIQKLRLEIRALQRLEKKTLEVEVETKRRNALGFPGSNMFGKKGKFPFDF